MIPSNRRPRHSCIFAFDNVLDGFGLAPVLKSAYGDRWWCFFLLFSVCAPTAAMFTATLRYYAPSPLLHLLWLSFATTSILVGSLELISYGLSLYVMLGMLLVWMVSRSSVHAAGCPFLYVYDCRSLAVLIPLTLSCLQRRRYSLREM